MIGMNLLDKLKERIGVMPKTVCIAGATALPPAGMALCVGILTAIYYSYSTIAPLLWGPALPSPPPGPASPPPWWIPYAILGLVISSIWIIAGLVAYIHCYAFWHDEKPEWAKNEEDRKEEFWLDFMDCPECEEIEPGEWHTLGECAHWGTTP